jgi:hypothetical protein
MPSCPLYLLSFLPHSITLGRQVVLLLKHVHNMPSQPASIILNSRRYHAKRFLYLIHQTFTPVSRRQSNMIPDEVLLYPEWSLMAFKLWCYTKLFNTSLFSENVVDSTVELKIESGRKIQQLSVVISCVVVSWQYVNCYVCVFIEFIVSCENYSAIGLLNAICWINLGLRFVLGLF